MIRTIRWICFAALIPYAVGCKSNAVLNGPPLAKVFFLDGAGNWGLIHGGVERGLRDAGLRVDFEAFPWTMTLNPLLDQWNVPGAKARAVRLARRIEEYHTEQPEIPIHVVAVSAGTGVATWAIEQLDDPASVDTVVFLGSSLSHDFDMTTALRHISGRLIVYHSPRDVILESVRVIGTIDGRRGVASAGLVGLKEPEGADQRIVNIPWSEKLASLGWNGGHSDCTDPFFVRDEVARHLMSPIAQGAFARNVEPEPAGVAAASGTP